MRQVSASAALSEGSFAPQRSRASSHGRGRQLTPDAKWGSELSCFHSAASQRSRDRAPRPSRKSKASNASSLVSGRSTRSYSEVLQSRVPHLGKPMQRSSTPVKLRSDGSRDGDKDVLDHVVVGAGVCGLVAAGELQKAGKRFIIFEKSSDIM